MIGQSSHKKLTDEQLRGLFGGKGLILIFACQKYFLFPGDTKMMNVLTKATKKLSVLAKSIVPRKYPPRSELDEGASHSRDRWTMVGVVPMTIICILELLSMD